jgi:hypothetical protein
MTEEEAARLLIYSPESPTGAVWASDRGKHKKGDVFGYFSGDKKYWRQKIDNRQFAVHRLIWIKTKGELKQTKTIDHKDRNGLNNTLENLREATILQQLQNRKSWSSVKFKGVSKVKNYKKYAAYLMYPNKGRIHLGYYDLEVHAALAHDLAAYLVFNNSEYYPLNFNKGFWMTERTQISDKVLEKLETFFETAVK